MKLSHVAFTELAFAIQQRKEEIQSRITNGLTVTDLAKEMHVSDGSMKSILTTCGIKHGREFARVVKEDAVRTVLRRICFQLDVPCPELDA